MSSALNTVVAYSVGRKETDEEDKMRRFVIGALLIALLLAGCTGPTPATPTDAPAGDVPAASAAEEGGTISAAGSTTVQPLAQFLGEGFVAANPGVRIEVQGGGSSVGVKSAVQGTADIGMASREIKASELEEYPSRPARWRRCRPTARKSGP